MTLGTQQAPIYDCAVRLLSQREHSAHELKNKLMQRGYEDESIEALIKKLQDQDLQSDARFVEQYVRFRARRGYGPLRIRGELQLRGIASSLMGSVEGQMDWLSVLRDYYVRRHGSTPPESFEERTKQLNQLSRRGFSTSLIGELLLKQNRCFEE